MLFKLKDFQDLRSKIAYLFGNEAICQNLGKNAFNMLNKEYSAQEHYKKLNNLFEKVLENYRIEKKLFGPFDSFQHL